MDFTEAVCEVLLQHKLFFELNIYQVQAIESLIAGRNIFCVLPTGTGKSIIYGLLGSLMKKVKYHNLIGGNYNGCLATRTIENNLFA